jgi:hypothetical protein
MQQFTREDKEDVIGKPLRQEEDAAINSNLNIRPCAPDATVRKVKHQQNLKLT